VLAVLIGKLPWPREFDLSWKALLAVLMTATGAVSFGIASLIPWGFLTGLKLVCTHVQFTGGLMVLSLALFAWYEFLRCRPGLQDRVQSGILWPMTSWMVWSVQKIKVRPHEVGTRSSSLDFLAGLGLVWALAPTWVLATACFITAWADPLARVIGKNFGRRRWPRSEKTYMGSFACALVATLVSAASLYIISGTFTAATLATATIAGGATAAAELIPQYPEEPKPGDMMSPADNLWLIVGSALALACAGSWI
jgi:dolichol kinase